MFCVWLKKYFKGGTLLRKTKNHCIDKSHQDENPKIKTVAVHGTETRGELHQSYITKPPMQILRLTDKNKTQILHNTSGFASHINQIPCVSTVCF